MTPATVGYSHGETPASFVAIDFETADEGRDSACAVALVRVEAGKIVAREARLIQPPRKAFVLTHIHGITWDDVASAQTFPAVWAELAPMLVGASLLVAHNASFDRSVVKACCEAARLDQPALDWACTVALARQAWPAWPTHKLDAVCSKLGIQLKHHDAMSDALACAEIYLRAQKVIADRAPKPAPAPAPVVAPGPQSLPEHVLEVHCENGMIVTLCRRCGVSEHFRGYDVEVIRANVGRRHTACSSAFRAAGQAPLLAAAPAPVAARPAPVAPVAALAPAQVGESLGLFGDVAPAARRPAKATTAKAPSAGPARVWSPLQEAIFADAREGAGHVRILARAGSGKSTTIVEALRHRPEGTSAALMAFGREAKEDLAKKARGLAEVMTLHGLGYRAMANAFGAAFVPTKGADQLRKAFPYSYPARRSVARLVGLAKNQLAWGESALVALADEFKIDPDPVAQIVRNPRLLPLQVLAQAAQVQLELALADTKRFDNDDMIWMPVRLGLPMQQWDRLFVDEAQDLNACQIAMLPRAITPGGRVTVVGDDRQAIYGFRGADRFAFERLGRELSAKTFPLNVSYRCPKSVARVAQEIVPDFESGPTSAEGTVRHVEAIDADELAPGDFVISRKNAPLLALCLELLAKDRPAIIQGKDVAGELEDLLDRAERDSGRGSIAATIAWIDRWHSEQTAARLVQGDPTDEIDDTRACLTMLLGRCSSVAAVRETLRRACGADREGDTKIVLTSAHRAKGLERERCYVLADTFRQRPGVEEDNLYYVAVTRAKRELVLVERAA